MTTVNAKYDISTNKWLQNTVKELNLQDAYNTANKMIEQKQTAEYVIKTRTNAAKKQPKHNGISFIAVRFIKKYNGAETSAEMDIIEEAKRAATRKYTGMIQRRQKKNKRSHAEQEFMKTYMKARAERRKFAQRTK